MVALQREPPVPPLSALSAAAPALLREASRSCQSRTSSRELLCCTLPSPEDRRPSKPYSCARRFACKRKCSRVDDRRARLADRAGRAARQPAAKSALDRLAPALLGLCGIGSLLQMARSKLSAARRGRSPALPLHSAAAAPTGGHAAAATAAADAACLASPCPPGLSSASSGRTTARSRHGRACHSGSSSNSSTGSWRDSSRSGA